MSRYLLSMYQPDGPRPDVAFLDHVAAELRAVNDELVASGGWVFSGGLHGPHAATVVRSRKGEAPITDGPYVEGKEHIGGIYVIDVPDLDDALHVARRISEATTLPIEVWPFHEHPER